MRKKNIIQPSSTPHLNSSFLGSVPMYRDKTTFDLTDNVENAITDIDGVPVVIEHKESLSCPESISHPPKPLSLSPCDPVARASCLEIFGMLNKKPSSPNIMLDRMDAHRYAENVSIALSHNIKKSLSAESVSNSTNNQPD